MINKYNPLKIEKKWQNYWEKNQIFKAKDFSKKKKFYCLDMFPYPSGEGLHVGHPHGYVATDIISHYKRLSGYNVLHPMGWDAFGLPAENYAIKNGVHPSISTKKNIKRFKEQIKSIGLSYDWSREINTTDPSYYKWTQWVFLLLFKRGLAYEAILPINFCPSCKTGLANEEVIDDKCERCGTKVVKKNLRQWVLKITAYADRLLKDLDGLDWPEKIITTQKNWIGKSEGWQIKFKVLNSNLDIEVFTTRLDTIFGCTYLVLSPEHPLINNLKDKILNYNLVKKYIEEAINKTERERISEVKEKRGIKLEGIKAINPANNKEIDIFIADYVLSYYGTGAVMAVPYHDQRDFDFAKKFDLEFIKVIKPEKESDIKEAYEGEGVLINSGIFNGMKSFVAREKIGEWLLKKNLAKKTVNYKLRDWIF
jgi:leucyl-tRNA synthetase